MVTVPQEIIDLIVGFLARDRPSLLACSLAGSGFYPPSRAHLFAEIEVDSLQRFQGLFELSSSSVATFNHESFKPFSSVRTVSVQGADAWITPELLPSLLLLPLLAPFPNVKDFRIDSLSLPGYIEMEGSPVMSTVSPAHAAGPRVGSEVGRGFGVSRGTWTNESFADPREERPAANLEALCLGNFRAPSLWWFLRYLSSFPDLKSLSLIDFTWGSVEGGDVDRCPPGKLSQPGLLPPRGLSELSLKIQYASLVACAPSLLFESLSGSLRILRLVHIDLFLSVDIDEGSIHLDPSYIALSPLKFLTHLTLPPVAVWLQAKQRWLPDLLSTIGSTANLKKLDIHLLFSPVSIKVQLDAVMWSSVDLILGRKWGEEVRCGIGSGVGTGRCGSGEGYVFANLEVVRITSGDFNPERPPLDGEARSRIKEWLVGYMPRIYERRVLQVPLVN